MNHVISKGIAKLLWVIVFVEAAIGMVIRRSLVLANVISSCNPAGGPPFDNSISKHPVIMFVHMLSGVVFMILGPLQFMPGIRARHIRFHRLSGWIFMISAFILGFSAMSFPFVLLPIGGVNEAAASTLFAIFFLVGLINAWRYILKRNIALHREWLIRVFAIGLAVSTVRPIIVMFFAFSGLQPQVFFGTAFWIGFTIHLIATEVWINYTRKR